MAAIISVFLPLLLIAPATLVSAVPNVTSIPTWPGTCAGFPNYYPEPGTDFTQPFYLHPTQADNSSINGLYTSISNNTVVIAVDPMLAKAMYSCTNGLLQEWDNSAHVFLSTDAENEVLAYLPAGYWAESYVHEINGVRQGGVFLGSNNVTTWAFKFLPGPGGAGSEDYYGMRLLGLDGTLEEGEFEGFIELVSA